MALGRRNTLITHRETSDGEDFNRHKIKSQPGSNL
jgi:hypothetical protein